MMNVQLIAQINNKLLALLLLVSTSSAFASELALIDAARQSSSETVQALLAEGADPNLSQPDGATALHWTVHRADSDSVAEGSLETSSRVFFNSSERIASANFAGVAYAPLGDRPSLSASLRARR